MKHLLVAGCVAGALCASPIDARADERPDTSTLVLVGLGMGIPTYFFNVLMHEGTHAVVAKAYGKEIVRFQWWPGRHPQNGRFYLGYVQYKGRLTTNQQTFFLMSPKITALVALGGYAALVGFDGLPEGHYSQLALAVLATGFWVDFTKDLLAFWQPNDFQRSLSKNGKKSFWQRLPYRFVYAALSAATGYAVLRGYDELLADDDPGGMMMAPMFQGSF